MKDDESKAVEPEVGLADEERDEDGEDLDIFIMRVTKGDAIGEGQAKAEEAEEELWASEEGVVKVPYNRAGLAFYFRNSSHIRPNVEAMVHNIDGFGWMPEAAIDFEAEDVREKVAVADYLDRVERNGNAKPLEDEQLTAKIEEWRREASFEKARMVQFFNSCCFETSFVDLRKRTRTDKEVFGLGAWEIIRSNGKPRRFIHVPGDTVRMLRKSRPVEVTEELRSSPVTYRAVKVMRRFRVYVQQDETLGIPKRYFKEMGDPRVISSKTGKDYESEEAMKEKEGGKAVAANELLLFTDYFPGSPYGAPRFHGVIPEIKGGYLAANHNVDYLENSAIPRGLLLVNDGRVNKKSARALKHFFSTMKGKAANRIAILQAQTPRDRALDGTGKVSMQWVSLAEAQREDHSFRKYDEMIEAKVGQQYRLPPILRGNTKDFNRATADAALQYSEEQVFSPERESFDWLINQRILPLLGIRFWRFRSRGPVKQDPEIMSKVSEVFLKYGVIVPAETRPIAERALGITLLREAGDWQNMPLDLVRMGFKSPDQRPSNTEAEANRDEKGDEGSEDKSEDEPDDTPDTVEKAEIVEAFNALRDDLGSEVFEATVDALAQSRLIDQERFASLFESDEE